jgi:hypothetical protein
MEINVEKFLAMTALLAAAVVPACTVESVDTGDHGGSAGAGTGGSSGSATGGSSGSATGGSSGASGSTHADASSDAPTHADGSDGGTACFAEDASDAGDAGAEGCDTLPYFATTCDDAGGAKPAGVDLCQAYEGAGLKASAFYQLLVCLRKLPSADACSQAHMNASDACGLDLYNGKACTVPAENVDGGAYGCPEIVASCKAGDAGADGGPSGISLDICNSWVQPWNAATRRAVIDCYLDPAAQGDPCAERFELCVPFPILP